MAPTTRQQAPTSAPTLIRPLVLPWPLGIELEGYTLVNWPIPADRLRSLVPAPFVPMTDELAGHRMAWLSLFIGRNVLRRIGPWPAFPVRFAQLNYRTYVKTASGHAAYVFRSVIGSDVVTRGMHLFPQFPADSRPFHLETKVQHDRLMRVRARVGQHADELDLEVRPAGGAPRTPGFKDAEAAVRFLGDVHDAFFPLADGRFGRLLSTHAPLRPEAGSLIRLECPWLETHGLLPDREALDPASIFLQAKVPFPTYM